MRGLLCALALVAATLFLPSLAHAAPPANDAFASAEVVSGPSGTVYGTRVEATAEPGEPAPMPQYHSIWYAWTAPAYGTLSFDTAGTAWAWAFTGDSLGALSMKINGQRYGFLSVKPGETYRIGLDDWNDGGPTQLSWSFVETAPPPANDDFANAQLLTADSGTIDVDTAGATKEVCEPTLGNGHSLWFSWVAPADGELTVQSITDTRGTIAAVFTGDSVCGLSQQAYSGGDPAVANVGAGQRYLIEVDTWTDAGGPTSFRYSFATPARPTNDDFANAQPFGDAYAGTVSGDAMHATSEPGEWTPFFGHTVWYTWTAPEDGLAHVSFLLGDGVVYSGGSLDALQTVLYDGGTFDAAAGTTYHVQVASSGQYDVEWLLEPNRPPANDDFANAQALKGDAGTVDGTNRLATLEPGEPDDGGTSGASVWYAWTAAADGTATFTVDSSFWTIHQVYTGDALGALVPVTGEHDVDAQRLSFAAQAGMTYRIVVDGRAGGTGRFSLGWSEQAAAGGTPEPGPDAFTTDEDTPLTLQADDLLANDTDPDGDALSLTGVASDKTAGHGTVSLAKGQIVFTPAQDFDGDGRFFYTVADPTGLEATGTVTVHISPVNDAPTVQLLPVDGASEGTPFSVVAVANDADGDPLTYDWSASLGTIEPAGDSATVTVDDGPVLTTVELTVSDGAESATATEDVAVANAAPNLDAAPATGLWGMPVGLRGAANDPSAADRTAGLAASWTAAGSVTAGLVANATWNAPGSYVATFSATDKDGGTGSLDVPVRIDRRASRLDYAGPASTPFGFGVLAARFGDRVDPATARPLQKHTVSFVAGPQRLSASSTTDGLASANVGAALLPGSYAIKASFAGDAWYGPSSTSSRLVVVNSTGKVTGDATLADGTPVAFSAIGDSAGVRGTFSVGSFTGSVSALGISGNAAWLAGALADGTPFIANVTDAAEPGAGVDSIAAWLGGVAQPGNGTIGAGNVQVHK